jgi:recombination protein U
MFEELVNLTNEKYMEHNLAAIQKIATPITPLTFDSESRLITKAYFEKKSTVDYIGMVQGIGICFDAKETGRGYLPLQNIHAHQIEFMASFRAQKGIAFLLVNFTDRNECYFLPFEILEMYWKDAGRGGRKSIPFEAFEKEYLVVGKSGYMVHYLEAVNRYLNNLTPNTPF